MVYLDESENREIESKGLAGFKIREIEKKPQTRATRLKPITIEFDRRDKNKNARRKTRDPEATMTHGKSGKKFPTMIPVISDRHTGIKGGKLR